MRLLEPLHALLRFSLNATCNAQQSSHCHFSSWLLLPSFRNRTGGDGLAQYAEEGYEAANDWIRTNDAFALQDVKPLHHACDMV